MPEVVCDTSPLQYLHQLGLLDLLPALASRVLIPPAVQQELAVGHSLGFNVPVVEDLSWVVVRQPVVGDPKAIPLIHDLGPGETEVLMLTLESYGTVAVLDDALARRVAGMLEVPFTGTLGLLIDGKKIGLIPAIRPLLDALQTLRFRMSLDTRTAVLKLAGEEESHPGQKN